MMYVVLVDNNEGGYPARLYPTLEAAKQAIRDYLTDPDNDPPQSPGEHEEMESHLAALTGECVESVRGSQAWKEWVYVSPLITGDEMLSIKEIDIRKG